MGIVTAGAILPNHRMFPDKGAALVLMTVEAGLVDRLPL